MRNGRFAEAYESMRRLRGTEIQACRDFYLAHSQLQMEAELARNPTTSNDGGGARWYDDEIYQREVARIGFFKRIWRLVSKGRNRRACYSSFIVMAAQILCGVRLCIPLLRRELSRVLQEIEPMFERGLTEIGKYYCVLLVSIIFERGPQYNKGDLA
jgi:hypothetical protein